MTDFAIHANLFSSFRKRQGGNVDPLNEDELGDVLIELIRALKSKNLCISDLTWLLSLSPKVREQIIKDTRPSAVLTLASKEKIDLQRVLNELEERTIRNALERAAWNKKAVAEQLGLSIEGLRARMETFSIGSPGDPSQLSDSTEERIKVIRNALAQAGWHQGKAAIALGISPQAVSKAIRRYKIKPQPPTK